MSTLLPHLREFGLSEKEATLYESLLTMKPTGVHEIAKESKIHRSSVYVLLAKLVERGFVTESNQNGVLKYQAVPPERLVEQAEKLAQSSAQQEKEMHSLLPELVSVSKRLKNQPHVLFYEGIGGMQTVDTDLLTQPAGTQVSIFLPIQRDALDPMTSILNNKDVRKTYNMKIISPSANSFKGDSLGTRYVPADKYPFSSELRIYADKIIFISATEEFGVIIQSQDVSDVMRSLFDLAWEEAGRLDRILRKKADRRKKD